MRQFEAADAPFDPEKGSMYIRTTIDIVERLDLSPEERQLARSVPQALAQIAELFEAAAAVFTPEGQKQTQDLINFYLGNAKLIREAMGKLGMKCIGGDNAPYIWINTGRDSWEFFDLLLNKAQVVCTPGAGFGKCGEGHVRISAFNSREKVELAMRKMEAVAGELR